MKDLHDSIVVAKNKLYNIYPWLLLLDIVIPSTPEVTFHIVNNTENVTFAGVTYTAYRFSIQLPSQTSAGDIPETALYVFDIKDTIREYIETLNGGYNTTVKLTIINAEFIDTVAYAADLIKNFDLLSVEIAEDAVIFYLGAPNPLRDPYPEFEYNPLYCAHVSRYKGFECKCTYPLDTCGGTLDNCRERNNSSNFGGQPGLNNISVRIIW